jgi:hypothetical protein
VEDSKEVSPLMREEKKLSISVASRAVKELDAGNPTCCYRGDSLVHDCWTKREGWEQPRRGSRSPTKARLKALSRLVATEPCTRA